MVFITACDKTDNVINNSSYSVTYSFMHNLSEYTLKPNSSDYYNKRLRLDNYSAIPPRVSYTNDYKTIEFFNTPAREIKIINNIDRDVFITAQGCIDNEPVIIPANSDVTENIYNNTPTIYGITIDGFMIKCTLSKDGQSVIINW